MIEVKEKLLYCWQGTEFVSIKIFLYSNPANFSRYFLYS